MAKGRLKKDDKIQQSIGRLMERYPRVARYYHIAYDSDQQKLSWKELADKKTLAQKLDSSYILKTDRQDLHREIYATLRISAEVIKPVKTWHLESGSDEKNLNYRKHCIRLRKLWSRDVAR